MFSFFMFNLWEGWGEAVVWRWVENGKVKGVPQCMCSSEQTRMLWMMDKTGVVKFSL